MISPYACKVTIRPKGLSVGSIILIYFFIFTGLYFIGGAMVLKFVRGATGWEMLPNLTFWREFSSLVKVSLTRFLSFHDFPAEYVNDLFLFS